MRVHVPKVDFHTVSVPSAPVVAKLSPSALVLNAVKAQALLKQIVLENVTIITLIRYFRLECTNVSVFSWAL